MTNILQESTIDKNGNNSLFNYCAYLISNLILLDILDYCIPAIGVSKLKPKTRAGLGKQRTIKIFMSTLLK